MKIFKKKKLNNTINLDKMKARWEDKFLTGKNIGKNVYCTDDLQIYNGMQNIFIGNEVHLVDALLNAGDKEGSITIEDEVFFGQQVKILARGHDYNLFGLERQNNIVEKPILIKKGAWIASGAIVLSGVTIGEHSVIGAGSVITKDVLPYCIYASNPTKLIKKLKSTI